MRRRASSLNSPGADLKYGVFRSGVGLQAAIYDFTAERIAIKAKPITWKADHEDIPATRDRGSKYWIQSTRVVGAPFSRHSPIRTIQQQTRPWFR